MSTQDLSLPSHLPYPDTFVPEGGSLIGTTLHPEYEITISLYTAYTNRETNKAVIFGQVTSTCIDQLLHNCYLVCPLDEAKNYIAAGAITATVLAKFKAVCETEFTRILEAEDLDGQPIH